MNKPYYPVLATITASRWDLLKAKLFGYRTQWVGDGYTTTLLHYKGVSYVVDLKPTVSSVRTEEVQSYLED